MLECGVNHFIDIYVTFTLVMLFCINLLIWFLFAFSLVFLSTQRWVRILGIVNERWMPHIIFAIANSLGNPVCLYATSESLITVMNISHMFLLIWI